MSDHPLGRIVCEATGPVLRIGIDRVAKRNGFTPVMLRELSAAYTRLEDEPGLRVGVLYALGEHFTAGLDLPSMAESMQRGERMFPDGWVDPLDLGHPGLRRRTKPTTCGDRHLRWHARMPDRRRAAMPACGRGDRGEAEIAWRCRLRARRPFLCTPLRPSSRGRNSRPPSGTRCHSGQAHGSPQGL